jgi:small-conductance mechanosensitive channel
MSANTVGTSLAGKIFPFLSMFIPTPTKLTTMVLGLYEAVNLSDIFALAVFGWCTMPMSEFLYMEMNPGRKQDEVIQEFRETYFWLGATIFSSAVKVAGVVLAADFLDIVMTNLEVPMAMDHDFGRIAAAIGYTAWIAYEVALFKHFLIMQAVMNSDQGTVLSGRVGESAVVDRFLNLAIALFAGLFLLDLLSVEMGSGLKSIFALGGAGTLVFSLASKDLAQELLSGLFLTASDKFYENDVVKLGDGTAGVVFKIGWMYTLIRGQ